MRSMRITESQLRRIIRQEVRALREAPASAARPPSDYFKLYNTFAVSQLRAAQAENFENFKRQAPAEFKKFLQQIWRLSDGGKYDLGRDGSGFESQLKAAMQAAGVAAAEGAGGGFSVSYSGPDIEIRSGRGSTVAGFADGDAEGWAEELERLAKWCATKRTVEFQAANDLSATAYDAEGNDVDSETIMWMAGGRDMAREFSKMAKFFRRNVGNTIEVFSD